MISVIYIMWLRQIKRYFRSKARIVGSLGQPLLFLLVFGFGMGPTFEQAGQGNYIQFLTPGIIAMSILFTAMFSGIEIVFDKQFGFLKETLVAPVSRLEIMIGRTLGGATTAVFQGLTVLVLSYAVGFRLTNFFTFPLVLLFMFIIAFLFTGLGTAIGSKLEDMHAFQLIMNFLLMPLFFLSGALFPLTGVPKVLSVIARFNPLTYGVDGLRASLLGVTQFSLANDFIILTSVTAVILAIGNRFFSKMQI